MRSSHHAFQRLSRSFFASLLLGPFSAAFFEVFLERRVDICSDELLDGLGLRLVSSAFLRSVLVRGSEGPACGSGFGAALLRPCRGMEALEASDLKAELDSALILEAVGGSVSMTSSLTSILVCPWTAALSRGRLFLGEDLGASASSAVGADETILALSSSGDCSRVRLERERVRAGRGIRLVAACGWGGLSVLLSALSTLWHPGSPHGNAPHAKLSPSKN